VKPARRQWNGLTALLISIKSACACLLRGVGHLASRSSSMIEDSYRQQHAPHALYMRQTIFVSTKNVFVTFHSLMGGQLTPALARATVQHTRTHINASSNGFEWPEKYTCKFTGPGMACVQLSDFTQTQASINRSPLWGTAQLMQGLQDLTQLHLATVSDETCCSHS